MRIFHTPLILLLTVATASSHAADPEFYGVYVKAQDGALVELKAHPQSGSVNMAIGGADLLRSISSVRVESGQDLEFVLYLPQVNPTLEAWILQVGAVRKQASLGFTSKQIEEVTDMSREYWQLTGKGIRARTGPVPGDESGKMMRIVPSEPIPDGVWAISVLNDLYDFTVDGQESAPCLVRLTHVTGVEYELCSSVGIRDTRRPSIAETQPRPATLRGDRSIDGTVTDPESGLMWTSNDNGSAVDWEGAAKYCEELDHAEFQDWRLPTLSELQEIYEPGPTDPSTFRTSLGLELTSCCPWSSTRDENARNLWFSFASGEAGRILVRFIDRRVPRALCVRSGDG